MIMLREILEILYYGIRQFFTFRVGLRDDYVPKPEQPKKSPLNIAQSLTITVKGPVLKSQFFT